MRTAMLILIKIDDDYAHRKQWRRYQKRRSDTFVDDDEERWNSGNRNGLSIGLERK